MIWVHIQAQGVNIVHYTGVNLKAAYKLGIHTIQVPIGPSLISQQVIPKLEALLGHSLAGKFMFQKLIFRLLCIEM